MTKKPVEAFLLTWNRVNLGIVGAWPEPNDKHELLQLFLTTISELIMIIANIIPQTALLFKIYSNFELVNESLTLANIPIIMELLKLIVIRNRRKELKTLVAVIYDDWNRAKSKLEIELMRSDAKIAKRISVTCFLVTATAFGSHIFKQSYVNSKRAESERQVFYIAYYPYEFLKTPAYEITCFFQCVGGGFSSTIFVGILSFCSLLILHVHGQFSILEHNIESLVNSKNFANSKEFLTKLRVIVTKHEDLNRFASTIENTFNQLFLLEMILYSLQLSMQFYNLMIIHGKDTINFLDFFFCLAYIFTIIANLFIVCYLGEKLKTAVFKLQYSVYRSKWYNLQTVDAKNLIMLFLKTETPLEITAGKFCVLSYETFAMIIKKSFAVLSVFLTMQQKV